MSRVPNSKLLTTPTELLMELERQDRFILLKALEPKACPLCGATIDLVTASGGKTVDDYDTRAAGYDNLSCPACTAKLVWRVPFMGPTYFALDPQWVKDNVTIKQPAAPEPSPPTKE